MFCILNVSLTSGQFLYLMIRMSWLYIHNSLQCTVQTMHKYLIHHVRAPATSISQSLLQQIQVRISIVYIRYASYEFSAESDPK